MREETVLKLSDVRVSYKNGKRFFYCPACAEQVRGSIPKHFRGMHEHLWNQFSHDFVRLFREGLSSTQIMRRYGTLFTSKVIDREIRHLSEKEGLSFARTTPVIGNLIAAPTYREKQRTTVWSFRQRGNWSAHDGRYPGNWSPQLVRNLLLEYTRKNELVLDMFLGGATTAIECVLLGRRFIGIDVSPYAISIARSKLAELQSKVRRPIPRIFLDDARLLTHVSNSSVDFACGQPPYLNTIRYTITKSDDLSHISDPDRFCCEMGKVARAIHRVLKPHRRCAILVGDVRRRGRLIPLGFGVMKTFSDSGFDLEQIIIKVQHNDSSTRFYATKKSKLRFRLAHEYLFVFKKRALHTNTMSRVGSSPTSHLVV